MNFCFLGGEISITSRTSTLGTPAIFGSRPINLPGDLQLRSKPDRHGVLLELLRPREMAEPDSTAFYTTSSPVSRPVYCVVPSEHSTSHSLKNQPTRSLPLPHRQAKPSRAELSRAEPSRAGSLSYHSPPHLRKPKMPPRLPIHITLFTRAQCALCGTAHSNLARAWQLRPFEFSQIDVMAAGQERWRGVYVCVAPNTPSNIRLNRERQLMANRSLVCPWYM